MSSDRKLRIALECRIDDPRSGVGSAILSLAHALSEAPAADQEYTFIVNEALQGWLQPHIFGPCRLAVVARQAPSRLKRALQAFEPLRETLRSVKSRFSSPPASDGFVESGNFDLVHFTSPAAYLTSLPTIYQPWDLQHAHFPEFFTASAVALREKLYRAFCEQAKIVCVQTEWCKRDVAEHLGIAPGKIEVVRWGSVFDAYREPAPEEQRAAHQKFNLPEQFFFYPAVTWPHKNHEDIIRAIHLLKTMHGCTIDAFFTGASTEFRGRLERLAIDLDVSGQIHYLGFVTPQELQVIFRAATAMVFPSKFEGFGLPILEAFHAGLPVLCSNASVLPEVAGDGALYFTPGCPERLAESMLRLLHDPNLRRSLVEEGTHILSSFSIADMARSFQHLYARLAGRALSSRSTKHEVECSNLRPAEEGR